LVGFLDDLSEPFCSTGKSDELLPSRGKAQNRRAGKM
jgi:hypothetical protein